jgi:hypothetical protein
VERTNWRIAEVPTHPLKDGVWVKIVAHIRNNESGEVRKYEMNSILDNGDNVPNEFIWEEGNYSCDCNRELFFEYANGKKGDEIESECGDGKFSVNLENPETGEIYYQEFHQRITI